MDRGSFFYIACFSLKSEADQFLFQSTRGAGSVPVSVARGNRLHPPPSCQVHVGVGTSHEVLPASDRRQRRVSEVNQGLAPSNEMSRFQITVVTTSSPPASAPRSSLRLHPQPSASPAAAAPRQTGPASPAAPPAAPPFTALSFGDPPPTTAHQPRRACRSTPPRRWLRPAAAPPPPSSARSPPSLCAGW